MDRNQAKKLLPIIQAYAEGKAIQVKDKRLSDEEDGWYETDDCSFNIEKFDYRIKPEPKYRPFKNAEECWQEMQKHQPFGWVKDRNGSKFVIENVDSRGFVKVYDEGTCSFKEVLENYTFADGAPFGVKSEE